MKEIKTNAMRILDSHHICYNCYHYEVEVEDDVEYLYAYITYNIIKYNTYYTSKVKVGEVSNE